MFGALIILILKKNDLLMVLFRLPNESPLRLLLACGRYWFDSDAVENCRRNTPLHPISMNSEIRHRTSITIDIPVITRSIEISSIERSEEGSLYLVSHNYFSLRKYISPNYDIIQYPTS